MRDTVYTYVQGLNLGTFRLSNEIPYDDNGVPLYIKNPKTIYISRNQTASEPIVNGLDGLHISNTATTVTVYFATDAKQVPSNYDTLVQSLALAKDVEADSVHTRAASVSTDYENDLLVTEVELTYSKIT